jgi:hypothetical protein
MIIRICRDDERDEILSIINAAAEAYHGVIPADCWHNRWRGFRHSTMPRLLVIVTIFARRGCLLMIVVGHGADRSVESGRHRAKARMALEDKCQVTYFRH